MYNTNSAETFANETATLTAPARQPQVAEAFDVLENSIEALAMNCADIEKRIDPVLRHEPEATGAGQTEAVATVVGVAQRINDSSDRIHRLNNQLNSILRRLEL